MRPCADPARMISARLRRALVVFTLVGLWPGAASAQLDEGVRLYEDADFRGALEAFDRAIEEGLSREQLARLYLVRAQVRFALDDQAEMMRDAARLAAVDPQHQLGRAVPPQVREAFEEARELGAGLTLEAIAEPMPDGVRIGATVDGDPGDVVREVRIAGRPVGSREWIVGTDGSLEVPSSGGAVEWYVEVIGEGGAVVRSEGRPDAPRAFGRSESVASEPPSDIVTPVEQYRGEEDEEGGVPVWLVVGGGVLGAALVVTAVVLIASSGGTSDDTQLSAPMFREP